VFACRDALMPVRWIRPEAPLFHTYMKATDVWSWGVCVFEMLSGEDPWVPPEQPPEDLLRNAQVLDFVESGGRLQLSNGDEWTPRR
jgi:serine/threonine protein kinase